MNILSFIQEAILRLKTKSPDFFVKLRIAMIVLGCALLCIDFMTDGVAIASAIDGFTGQHIFKMGIQAFFDAHIQSVITIIATVTGVAFLPVKNAADVVKTIVLLIAIPLMLSGCKMSKESISVKSGNDSATVVFNGDTIFHYVHVTDTTIGFSGDDTGIIILARKADTTDAVDTALWDMFSRATIPNQVIKGPKGIATLTISHDAKGNTVAHCSCDSQNKRIENLRSDSIYQSKHYDSLRKVTAIFKNTTSTTTTNPMSEFWTWVKIGGIILAALIIVMIFARLLGGK